jgi:hypothetical protein
MPPATTDARRRSFDQMAQLYARATTEPPPRSRAGYGLTTAA